MELMTIDNKGIELIKKWEGCVLTAYKPVSSEKYYTIGIGHYGADVKKGQKITMQEAENLLRKDIAVAERTINALGINFKQCQFNTLASWIFNLGIGNFSSSTLRKKIVAHANDEDITDQIIRWVNSNGKPLLGLKRRRVEEANMWLGRERYFIDANGNILKRK